MRPAEIAFLRHIGPYDEVEGHTWTTIRTRLRELGFAGDGLPVRRVLPHRERRRVGPSCFLDETGPATRAAAAAPGTDAADAGSVLVLAGSPPETSSSRARTPEPPTTSPLPTTTPCRESPTSSAVKAFLNPPTCIGFCRNY